VAFRSISGPVELATRALEAAEAERVLVALPPQSGLPGLWSESVPEARYVHLDYSIYRKDRELFRRTSGRAEELSFLGMNDPGNGFRLAVLFAPKEKELIEYLLGWIAERVQPSGRVLVAGENRAGIRSVKAILEGTVGPVTGHRSARHSVIWEAVRSEEVSPPRSFRREFEVDVAGTKLRVVSYPGVFSHGELDPGTRFLLEALDRPRFRRALDWGCGSGAIGSYLQLLRPEASVDLVDSHAMALRSARETLEMNQLSPERVAASDGFSDVRGTFDLIVTNPPFHAGVKTELSVTERMIRESGRFLVPGGRLVLVANAFLRYPAVLRESFSEVRVLAENGSYRVFEAKNE
jgi:16S rRNA (guanine1207-N2)-methyltransferase